MGWKEWKQRWPPEQEEIVAREIIGALKFIAGQGVAYYRQTKWPLDQTQIERRLFPSLPNLENRY